MKLTKKNLQALSKAELDLVLKNYLPADILDEATVQAVWTESKERPEHSWEALALKFNKKMKNEDLLSTVVSLRADEYWGKVDGHHVFWFD